jgi:hypothetical protein
VKKTAVPNTVTASIAECENAYLHPKKRGIIWELRARLASLIAPKGIR